ncbi:MAG: hypothetical protein K8S55_11385 [Phycisphaerae bacterium]|nr:hypothetical protein [Phycisphaerae bacterium]
MKNVWILIVTGVLCVQVSSVAAGKAARLVNEKQILDSKTVSHKRLAYRGTYALQLSPHGKELLYRRHATKPADISCYELALRNIANGKDTILPIPAFHEGDWPAMMLKNNLFDATGAKIIIGTGVDANGDGILREPERGQLVAYDIATGKLTPLLERGCPLLIMSTIRKGKGVALTAIWDTAILCTITLGQSNKIYPVAKWPLCMIFSISPTADLVAMMVPDEKSKNKWPPEFKFVLYDYRAKTITATLPDKLSIKDPCRWTRDGRYLCYVCKPHTPKGRKKVVRFWDCRNKQSKIVADGVLAGIGPGNSTILVTTPWKKPDKTSGKKPEKIQSTLYDISSGKPVKLGEWPVRAICTGGKYLLYAKPDKDGKTAIYRAEIVLPKPPAKGKNAKKEPVGDKR